MAINISTYMFRHFQSIFDDLRDQLPVRHSAGRKLNNLLISSLNAAFAFPEMRYVSGTVPDDLYFDMPEAIDRSFFSKDLLGWALFNRSFH